MATIAAFDVLAVDLPFRTPFKHAAAERESSSSVFLRCETESGTVGYGESLPRDYVTGESRDGVVDMFDILCVLDGFSGQFETCSLESLDIADCTPDDEINLSDILAVLDGFQGVDPCCGN